MVRSRARPKVLVLLPECSAVHNVQHAESTTAFDAGSQQPSALDQSQRVHPICCGARRHLRCAKPDSSAPARQRRGCHSMSSATACESALCHLAVQTTAAHSLDSMTSLPSGLAAGRLSVMRGTLLLPCAATARASCAHIARAHDLCSAILQTFCSAQTQAGTVAHHPWRDDGTTVSPPPVALLLTADKHVAPCRLCRAFAYTIAGQCR